MSAEQRRFEQIRRGCDDFKEQLLAAYQEGIKNGVPLPFMAGQLNDLSFEIRYRNLKTQMLNDHLQKAMDAGAMGGEGSGPIIKLPGQK